jgi:hypothetical protein
MSIAPMSHTAISADPGIRLDVGGGLSVPDLLIVEHPRPGDGNDAVSERQCGRCRATFPGDPALHPVALAEWWLCPACRVALLGTSRPGPAATGSHPPIGANRGG